MITSHCPICGRLMQAASVAGLPYAPFCSARCRQIDLGRWLREDYRLPADEPEGEGSPPADPSSAPP
jgi:endogenous inhibitor of DNA gyrase (YacG/DUF329 family)